MQEEKKSESDGTKAELQHSQAAAPPVAASVTAIHNLTTLAGRLDDDEYDDDDDGDVFVSALISSTTPVHESPVSPNWLSLLQSP